MWCHQWLRLAARHCCSIISLNSCLNQTADLQNPYAWLTKKRLIYQMRCLMTSRALSVLYYGVFLFFLTYKLLLNQMHVIVLQHSAWNDFWVLTLCWEQLGGPGLWVSKQSLFHFLCAVYLGLSVILTYAFKGRRINSTGDMPEKIHCLWK